MFRFGGANGMTLLKVEYESFNFEEPWSDLRCASVRLARPAQSRAPLASRARAHPFRNQLAQGLCLESSITAPKSVRAG